MSSNAYEVTAQKPSHRATRNEFSRQIRPFTGLTRSLMAACVRLSVCFHSRVFRRGSEQIAAFQVVSARGADQYLSHWLLVFLPAQSGTVITVMTNAEHVAAIHRALLCSGLALAREHVATGNRDAPRKFLTVIRNGQSACGALSDMSGFTLIELLVTLAVVAILSLIAVPSYRNFVESSRLTTATNDFVGDISLARIAAMKAGPPAPGSTVQPQAIICVLASGPSCATASSNWQAGWMVFLDNDGNGAFNSSNDTVLKVHDALPSSLSTTVSPTGTTANLVFNRIGFMMSGMTSLQISDTGTNQSRLICLNQTGRVATASNTSVCP